MLSHPKSHAFQNLAKSPFPNYVQGSRGFPISSQTSQEICFQVFHGIECFLSHLKYHEIYIFKYQTVGGVDSADLRPPSISGYLDTAYAAIHEVSSLYFQESSYSGPLFVGIFKITEVNFNHYLKFHIHRYVFYIIYRGMNFLCSRQHCPKIVSNYPVNWRTEI